MSYVLYTNITLCLSQLPHGLRLRSAAANLLRLWVRIPPGAWMFVCCDCLYCQVEVSATSWSLVQRSPTDCGASLCVIKKPREWGGPGPLGGCCAKKKQIILYYAHLYCGIHCWLRLKAHVGLTVFLFDKYASDHEFTCLIHYENNTGKQETTLFCFFGPCIFNNENKK